MKKNKNTRQNGHSPDMARWTVRIYLFLMLSIFPLYYRHKYYDMGDSKYLFFRTVTLAMLAVLAAALLYSAFSSTPVKSQPAGRHRTAKHDRRPAPFLRYMVRSIRLSCTDLAVLAYVGAAVLSWLLSPFRTESWIGSSEWYMGLLSQLLFAGIYFAVSRFGSAWKWTLWLSGAAMAAVCMIAYLHRFQIDPLGFYDGLSDHYRILFLSTIGQATWYSSYLCVVLPVIMGIYLVHQTNSTSGDRLTHILNGLLLFLGFCSAVTQNSDSIYIGLGLAFLFLLWFALEQPDLWIRYLELWLLALTAAKFTGMLQLTFPETVPALDPLSLMVTQSRGGWLFLVTAVILYAATRLTGPYLLTRNRSLPSPGLRPATRRIRTACYILFGIGIITFPVLIWLNTTGRISIDIPFWQQTSYLTFNEEWGNGRGKTWAYCAGIFAEYPPLQKLFGYGPDTLTFYSEAYHAETVQAMWGGLQLTNAHNEWFTALIHYGIIGAAAYLSIFVTAVVRILRNRKQQPFLLPIAAAILSYAGHNFFCYQQAVCTPLIFIAIGAAESLIRSQNTDRTS